MTLTRIGPHLPRSITSVSPFAMNPILPGGILYSLAETGARICLLQSRLKAIFLPCDQLRSFTHDRRDFGCRSIALLVVASPIAYGASALRDNK